MILDSKTRIALARRIQERDIEPRDTDSLQLQVALRAYQNWIVNQITDEQVKRLHARLLEDLHAKGMYNETPNHHIHETNG